MLGTVTRREFVEWGFQRDHEIIRATKSFKECYQWAINRGLIPEVRSCKKCQYQLKIVKWKYAKTDGHLYLCLNNYCRSRWSIKEGSIFDYSALTMMETSRVIFHYYVRNINATQAYLDLKDLMKPSCD
jgi:hypothetical protein